MIVYWQVKYGNLISERLAAGFRCDKEDDVRGKACPNFF